MIRKSFKTAFVALACSLGLTLGATEAFAQHAPEGAVPHGAEAAKGGEGHGGGHEGGHGEGHGGGHGHGPKPMNMADFSNKETPPYVALLVNFGLLAFAYYSLGKKPVAEALKQRKEDIGKEIIEAQKLLDDALARGKDARKKLKNVDGDKKEAVETLVETGEGERDKIVREAEEKAARVGRDASFLVEQEAKQLRLDITKETVELAVAKAEALLKATVTQADHDRLAEEFLAELATKSEKPAVKAGGAA
ncbi:MAG: ATP synthase F0 subunit B [Myxococcales bacterium]|jgi:F0F1-type ATP synthase membrane subunit b/b'|nr:ATP synthase F0 subunit B [Myxococcales bacterium]